MAERAMEKATGAMAEVEGPESLEEHEAYFSSHLEAWKNRYREEGREEGLKERWEEGLAKGCGEGLCCVVTIRFGEAAAERVGRLLGGVTASAILDDLMETAVTSESVDVLVNQLTG